MSGTERDAEKNGPEAHGTLAPAAALHRAVLEGDLAAIRRAIADGADINALDAATGLAPLHLAVGFNDLPMTRFLAEDCGAGFFPDRFGRWPTLVAAENRVDEAMSDYIAEQEAAWLDAHPDNAP